MVKIKPIYLTISLSLFASSCAHIIPSNGYKEKHSSRNTQLKKQTPTQTITSFTKDTEALSLDQAITTRKGSTNTPEPFLRKVNNKDVKFWVKYFTTRNKAGLERFIKNGETYKPIVEDILKKYGLPADLYYVGLIESGYQNRAKSHAGAVGPWQFVKGTARRYGLKVNRKIDERKNIYKSTEAAALYFQDLYNIFGSWELALAAYNAGEYGIIRRIRGANTREYYELSRRKIIPRETRNYVPKVLAVMKILANPRKYNVKITKPKKNIFINAKAHKVYSSISLKNLSKKLHVSPKIIKALNHDILGHYIPYTGKKGVEIFLPNNSNISKADLKNFLKSQPAKKYKRTVKSQNYDKQMHRVRKNESIYSISRRYGVSINKIKTINKIKGDKIYIGQSLRLPLAAISKVLYSYTVKKGDNLSVIAGNFKTSINGLKKMNKIRRAKIFIGQKLKVPAHKTINYIVKKGDILERIAKSNNQSIKKIKRFNNIKNYIYPGQKIIVDIRLL